MTGKFGELVIILIIVLILFGAGKLPRVLLDVFRSIRIIRKYKKRNKKK